MKPFERKGVRLLVAVVAAVALVRAAAWVAAQGIERRARLDALAETVSRTRAVVASAGAARDSLGMALRSIVELAPSLVAGGTEAEAAASLTGLVQLAADRSRLRVARLEPVSMAGDGPFRPVAVLLAGEGDVAGLVRVLGRIELGNPLLSVRDLAVQAPWPGADGIRPEQLNIEMTVSGWYLPRGAR